MLYLDLFPKTAHYVEQIRKEKDFTTKGILLAEQLHEVTTVTSFKVT